MPYSLESEELYKKYTDEQLDFKSKCIKVITLESDGIYTINPYMHVNKSITSLADLDRILKHTKQFVGIEIPEEAKSKLNPNDCIVFKELSLKGYYTRDDYLSNELFLLDWSFANNFYFYEYNVLLVRRQKNGEYIIEPCPNKENLILNILDERIRKKSFSSGLYLQLKAPTLDKDYEAFYWHFKRDNNYSYMINRGTVFVLPAKIENLGIREKCDYLHLIREGKPILIKDLHNGEYVIALLKDNSVLGDCNVGYLIDPNTYLDYISDSLHFKKVEDSFIKFTKHGDTFKKEIRTEIKEDAKKI